MFRSVLPHTAVKGTSFADGKLVDMYFHLPEVFQELQILLIFLKQIFQNAIGFLIKVIQIKC